MFLCDGDQDIGRKFIMISGGIFILERFSEMMDGRDIIGGSCWIGLGNQALFCLCDHICKVK